jgi:hypothetical protein
MAFSALFAEDADFVVRKVRASERREIISLPRGFACEIMAK